jgi:hypothetical protein
LVLDDDEPSGPSNALVHVEADDVAAAFLAVIDEEVRSQLGRAKGDPDYCVGKVVPRGRR